MGMRASVSCSTETATVNPSRARYAPWVVTKSVLSSGFIRRMSSTFFACMSLLMEHFREVQGGNARRANTFGRRVSGALSAYAHRDGVDAYEGRAARLRCV